MIKKFDGTLFVNHDILLDEDSVNVTFSRDEIGILSVDLDNINLDDFNFDEDGPETIIHVRLMAWRNKLKQRKSCKKDLSKELMPAAWYPTRWQD